MKKAAVILSSFVILLAACGDNESEEMKYEGGDQLQEPVLNSGPATEMERATDAVRDSSVRVDSNAMSTPH